MSQDQQEYRDKAAGKNWKGNTDHRKQGSCMQAAAPVVVTIGLAGLLIRKLTR